ncbi:serine acetyltransferase [Vibrio hannami]|uniref:serine acetyltransferase n=1 Tax=Vibrio hannami TaxID=2717094 RepID=UPI00240FA4DB|nr:serine acetyltransferase [Vibrio hannami]MDG3088254.1 serine acetyltransferase [Vibrio hannami]
MKNHLVRDIVRNKGNTKGLIFIILFRICRLSQVSIFTKVLFFPLSFLYKLTVQWILGIDIPLRVSIGEGFVLYHGVGVVVHPSVIIGKNVTMRQSTTIGIKYNNGKAPIIGDNVDIGAHSVLVGDITIGSNVIIGAGTTILKTIDSGLTVVNENKVRVLNG